MVLATGTSLTPPCDVDECFGPSMRVDWVDVLFFADLPLKCGNFSVTF